MIYDEVVNEYEFDPELALDMDGNVMGTAWYPWDDLFGSEVRMFAEPDIPTRVLALLDEDGS